MSAVEQATSVKSLRHARDSARLAQPSQASEEVEVDLFLGGAILLVWGMAATRHPPSRGAS